MTADPPPQPASAPPAETDSTEAMEGVVGTSDNDNGAEDLFVTETDAPPTPTPTPSTTSIAVAPRILLHRDADEEADEDEDVDMPLSRPSHQPPQSLLPSAPTSATADTVAAPAAITTADETTPWTSTHMATATGTTGTTPAILSRIITPSPFPQHTPQSRFRRALRRVALRPTRDAEAWEAVIAEAAACYRSLLDEAVGRGGLSAGSGSSSAAVLAISITDDPAIHARLDWVESCYGALVAHFPGAAHVQTALAELLFAQSSRPDDDEVSGGGSGGGQHYGRQVMPWETNTTAPSRRSLVCEAKLHHLLRTTLGVSDWSVEDPVSTSTTAATVAAAAAAAAATTTTNATTSSPDTLCSWCVELWLVYIKTKARELRRGMGLASATATTALSAVRDATVQAYELATSHAGFGPNQHLLWRQYIEHVQSWTNSTAAAPGTALDHAVSQQQLVRLRSIYQRAVALPGIDLDAFWAEYEAFEVSRSAALASALLAELRPKWQHAKTVYLERSRVCGGATNATMQPRLATEPVRATTARMTATLGADGATPSAAAGATVGGVEGEGGDVVDDEDDAAKLEEEYRLLKLWKVRCAYERTNPERLPNPKDLQHRIRTAFKEMACALTRHPESWHMWSAWELQVPASPSSSTATEGPTSDATSLSSPSTRARTILQLAQTHIPDSTLLCYAEAQIVELHTDRPADCIDVMEQMLQRSPNTLAFALCQRMVRRYRGITEARAVFARARRVLDPHPTSVATATAALTTGAASKRSSVVAGRHGDGGADDDEDGEEAAANEAAVAAAAAAASAELQGGTGDGARNPSKRWMVTNRLDENIPPVVPLSSDVARPDAPKSAAVAAAAAATAALAPPPTGLAPITWHLYASHATIEHRLNGVPEVAARVYELGLRKHAAFLTQPPYVMRYAQLLLELRDPVNLRSLLTRAIAACHDAASSSSSDSNPMSANSSRAALPVLWDVYLRFESVLSASDPMGAKRLHEIEAKRRQATLGADLEDVATGGLLSTSDVALVGAQKAPISELLVRAEGYDASSNIVSGLSREVDLLDTMGLWGSDASALSLQRARYDPDVEVSGGASDASYHRRLKFQTLAFSGASTEAAALESSGLGGRGMSARERLQQGSAASMAAGAPGQPTAMMLAIQQSPEWLRPLLLLLPASRLRLPIVSKPSPQVVELALNTLRQNQLPAERPADASMNGSGRKRLVSSGMVGGGDSSDEEDGAGTGQGYGNFFRSRQRARMSAHAGTSDQDAAS